MQRQSKRIIIFMLFLAVLGIIISGHLVEQHYYPDLKGSGIVTHELFSVSVLNTSYFSEAFGVALAVFGMLWFILIALMTWLSFDHPEKHLNGVMLLHLLSIPVVIYLIIAEILLKIIGPYATSIHAIIFLSAVCCFFALKKYDIHFSFQSMVKQALLPLLFFIILSGGMIGYVQFAKQPVKNYDAFAQCLAEKEIKVYVSYTCIICQKTSEMFGSSYRFIEQVECNPKAQVNQADVCKEIGIYTTPTWIIHKGDIPVEAHSGFLNIPALEAFSGCVAS